MSAAARPAAPAAAPSLFRHHRLERPSWWRCVVEGLWGTVTGYVELGAIVTTYDVQLDRGGALRAWPASVKAPPATDATGAPQALDATAARSAGNAALLRCIPGGRP